MMVVEDEPTPGVSPVLMTNGISLASWMQRKRAFISFPVGQCQRSWDAAFFQLFLLFFIIHTYYSHKMYR